MAASTRALTPTQAGSLRSTLEPPTNALPSLAQSVLQQHRSVSPKSPRAMSPRIAPAIAAIADAVDRVNEEAVRAAKHATQATAHVSTPIAEAAKTAAAEGSHNRGVSLSGFDAATTAPTRTAPAITSMALPHQSIIDPKSGRPVVDPGLSGAAAEATPNRAFTFPPPLSDDHHTPSRNLSVPNTGFPGSGSSRGSGSKRHKCQFCATEFTRHHNLKSHLLTHSQEKPYECTQCQQRFRRLHDLKRHTKLHTGERPHECNVCGRKFARGDALARHNKGPGGCAGRRPSFIEEDPSGSRLGDDSMDGVEYTAEPEHMDEDDDEDDDMNGATPHDSAKKGPGRQDTFRPNTYPGVVGPPIFTSGQQAGRDPSMPSQGQLSTIQSFNAGVFQGSMTESPKPISPGQSGDRGASRLQFLPAGRGTSPMTLPTPTTTTGSSSGPSLPPILFASHPPTHQNTGGSLSSLNSGSSATSAQPIDVWGIVRELETRMRHEMETRLGQMVAEYRSEIEKLRNELRATQNQSAQGASR